MISLKKLLLIVSIVVVSFSLSLSPPKKKEGYLGFIVDGDLYSSKKIFEVYHDSKLILEPKTSINIVKFEIFLEDLPKGMYFVKVSSVNRFNHVTEIYGYLVFFYKGESITKYIPYNGYEIKTIGRKW